MRTILLPLALAAATQAQLVTFSGGSPAKASEVNGNFAYLAARLDSLTKAQSSRLDSLAKALAAKDSAAQRSQERQDSLGKALAAKDAGTPKGAIAGFLTKPGTDGYLPNSDQTWMLAAGQKGVHGFDSLPNLRGVFLRGGEIDFNVAGGTMGYTQRDTLRTPGSYQDDAFQGHWHQVFMGGNSAKSGTLVSQSTVDRLINDRSILMSEVAADIVADGKNGTPRTASETRPKNVAVYWYIKVK